VVEADRAHADLHLAGRGRRRRLDVDDTEVAVAEELESAHQVA
jgi:hypothetical protein